MMQYNIENSFSKLRKMPTAKVEVKKEGNITEVKKKKTEIAIPKGVTQESEKGFPGNGQLREVHPINR